MWVRQELRAFRPVPMQPTEGQEAGMWFLAGFTISLRAQPTDLPSWGPLSETVID